MPSSLLGFGMNHLTETQQRVPPIESTVISILQRKKPSVAQGQMEQDTNPELSKSEP